MSRLLTPGARRAPATLPRVLLTLLTRVLLTRRAPAAGGGAAPVSRPFADLLLTQLSGTGTINPVV